MFKNYFVAAGFVLLSVAGFSQTTPNDTVPVSPKESLDFDTTFDYDELLDELDVFLDSLLMPRSYFLASISAGSGYFNYFKRNDKLETIKKGRRKIFLFSPISEPAEITGTRSHAL